MRKTVLLFSMVIILTCCEDLGLKSEKFSHEVIDVDRNDYFIIENKKKPAFAYFTIEGELSHDAVLLWSGSEPDTDTVFSLPNEILLPKGKVKIVDNRGDYYGQKLYVKYESLNDSTSGDLQIKIRM